MKVSYNKLLVKCFFCGRSANRNFSEMPPERTPSEDIAITYGKRRMSFCCNNPEHGTKYTIYCLSTAEHDSMVERYKSK